MADITVEIVFGFITIIFALIALVLIFRVMQRTGKRLCLSYRYLFLAMLAFGAHAVLKLVELLDGLRIHRLLTEIMKIAFIILFVIGVWEMQKCVKEVDGEIRANSKIHISKKG